MMPPPARLFRPRSTACRSTMRPRKASCAARPSSIPRCKFAFRVPPAFACSTNRRRAGHRARPLGAVFLLPGSANPGTLVDWMRDKVKPTPTDIQSTEIGGAEAAIGARPRGSDTGLSQVRYVVIRRDTGVCYFNLVSDSPDRDRRIETMVEASAQLPLPVRRRGGSAAALSPARCAAWTAPRRPSSPRACPMPTSRWTAC